MKSVCIVQARLNSTRLPHKVLLPLNGHTVIGEVLTRCKQIPDINEVICAIPKGDKKLALEAEKYGPVFLGPEDDVLGRYYRAAKMADADYIVRVTGDCPLISPELCGEILWRLKDSGTEYASNVHPRTFPQGYDCEAFTFKTLEKAYENAPDGWREHVTTYMIANSRRVNITSPWRMDGRLTLDTEDDYRTICAAFGHQPYERVSKTRSVFDPAEASERAGRNYEYKPQANPDLGKSLSVCG